MYGWGIKSIVSAKIISLIFCIGLGWWRKRNKILEALKADNVETFPPSYTTKPYVFTTT